MINSKQKGARAEREFSSFVKEYFQVDSRRGVQYQGSPDSPDIVCNIPNLHFEVKHVEKLNIYNAMTQASEDASADQIPVVAHRRNHYDWLITIKASDINKFIESIGKIIPNV